MPAALVVRSNQAGRAAPLNREEPVHPVQAQEDSPRAHPALSELEGQSEVAADRRAVEEEPLPAAHRLLS